MRVDMDDTFVADCHKAIDALANRVYKLKTQTEEYPMLNGITIINNPDPEKKGRPSVIARASVTLILYGSSLE
jgi:hypothetical protein